MRWADDRPRDAGMVTVELAAALPVLVLIAGVLLSGIVVLGESTRVQDAAGEAARLYARGDTTNAHAAVASLAPGSSVDVTRSGADVQVTVTRPVHLFAHWLPAVRVTGRAVSVVEPTGQSP